MGLPGCSWVVLVLLRAPPLCFSRALLGSSWGARLYSRRGQLPPEVRSPGATYPLWEARSPRSWLRRCPLSPPPRGPQPGDLTSGIRISKRGWFQRRGCKVEAGEGDVRVIVGGGLGPGGSGLSNLKGLVQSIFPHVPLARGLATVLVLERCPCALLSAGDVLALSGGGHPLGPCDS